MVKDVKLLCLGDMKDQNLLPYMNIINVNCGVKNYMKDHHRRALQRYRRGQGFESRTCLNFFSGFIFATAKVAYITAMIFLHMIMIVLILMIV